jgi:hypothetical protein
MLTLNTTTLRRALDLQEKIEGMQTELSRLLGRGATLTAAALATTSGVVAKWGRKPGRPKGSGRKPGRPAKRGRKPGRPAKKAAKAGRRKTRVSPLKGKKRPASPSGPLGPAVIKVMKRAGGALNVDAVLQGLKDDKYVWKVKDAKKNLAARIYTLKGVKKVGPGKFALKK